jgi:ABC-type polysaccharide/polyol phosphate transport system ATPase subunit
VKPILEIQNVSKRFLIHHQRLPYLTFRETFIGMFRASEKKETFWALSDVSFDVMPGDAIGIVGRNGAGKSTLLKILSRITPPTRGRIICRGRMASLLEVGTGFHQELTGRENIYMNGSILGMKRAEINARFDEIVDFSGVEKFLDTPLKYYSSGMQLRLAFAVAAHLEPEILVVDEVLAVGDQEFQKKCLKKMSDATGAGRTVLFVSHNLSSLKSICRTGALLRDGTLASTGSIKEVVDTYLAFHQNDEPILDCIHYFQPVVAIKAITINGSERNSLLLETDSLNITLIVEFKKRTTFELDVHLKKDEQAVISYANFVKNEVPSYEQGEYRIEYNIRLPELRSGNYKLDLYFTEPFVSWFAVCENLINVDVVNSDHHTFLNNSNLKWGSILAPGSYRRKSIPLQLTQD